MYSYKWDEETGGLLLNSSPLVFSKEPRPVYYQELDILGFDQHWHYEKSDAFPYMWAEANTYWYRGRKVAQTRGGSLYTAPELVLLEEPEPNGEPLRFVDIDGMVAKNRSLMEQLVQDTIKDIFNTYTNYSKKVDVFYVAFSGGKDSIVLLDMVQQALPHKDFIVFFGNTDMEFNRTLEFAEQIKEYCESINVAFYEASSNYSAMESWTLFGPPSRRVRWCCSVHKTAPVINKVREVSDKKRHGSVMITGVRADESSTREDYDEFSKGQKVAGQYSYHPLLSWSSSEIFLHIYSAKLPMNPLYKLGFNRVGCVMCPNSSGKHEYIKRRHFPSEVDAYCEKIESTSSKDMSGENRNVFLDTGGWKARFSGRELRIREKERVVVKETPKETIITVENLNPNWKIWYKTIGDLHESYPEYNMEFEGTFRNSRVTQQGSTTIFTIEKKVNNKNHIEFVYLFKSALIKAQYCINCKVCEAECPYNFIRMSGDSLIVSDNCVKCRACLRVRNGCLYYDSIRGSMSVRKLKGVNRYLSVGVEADFVKKYLEDDSFEPGNRKTDVMFGFMNDAGITLKRKLTSFGELVRATGAEHDYIWALIICNLVYTPAFNWYVLNVPFNTEYTNLDLLTDMGDEVTKKAKNEFWNGFKVILLSNESFQRIGIGVPEIDEQLLSTGEKRRSMNSVKRCVWSNPDPRVILYSLYKFSEACGDYHAFTLSRLLNHDIESDGVSPTEIFGLGREEMQGILMGLGVNHPEFIHVTFTHDLDNINLSKDKTSQDVLALF